MTSVLEKLKALDAQRAQLLEGAKKEALDNAEKAVAELNELGFHYTLTEGAASTASAPRKHSQQAPKRQVRDVPCPICHFKTTPHHDGRMHRSQKTKKPFTVEELMEKVCRGLNSSIADAWLRQNTAGRAPKAMMTGQSPNVIHN